MKARIKITCTIDVDLKPEWYPNCTTDDERLQVVLGGVNEDPFLFMDNENAEWEITGELEIKAQ